MEHFPTLKLVELFIMQIKTPRNYWKTTKSVIHLLYLNSQSLRGTKHSTHPDGGGHVGFARIDEII